MSSLGISAIVFACVFGAALFGSILRKALPLHHLSADSKDVVKLGMGLVGTMSALVLGLLISSAKSHYDTQNSELNEMSARIILLDRTLAHYGPEANDAREVLRGAVVRALDNAWPQTGARNSRLKVSAASEGVYDKIQELSPKDDAQRSIRAQALNLAVGLGQMRWLMYEQQTASVSHPMLVVLVFWLAAIFMSFGLLSSPNATSVSSLFVSALSVSGAIFLILEMFSPYAGLLHLSSAPLQDVLAHLGR